MVNMDGRFTVSTMPGVAFFLKGYVEAFPEESWTLDCSEDHEHDDTCVVWNEPEQEEDTSKVRAVMVGDDHVHIVDVDDLTEITEEDYCPGCGQTGCGHGRDLYAEIKKGLSKTAEIPTNPSMTKRYIGD
jgi:hypothetical protein